MSVVINAVQPATSGCPIPSTGVLVVVADFEQNHDAGK